MRSFTVGRKLKKALILATEAISFKSNEFMSVSLKVESEGLQLICRKIRPTSMGEGLWFYSCDIQHCDKVPGDRNHVSSQFLTNHEEKVF